MNDIQKTINDRDEDQNGQLITIQEIETLKAESVLSSPSTSTSKSPKASRPCRPRLRTAATPAMPTSSPRRSATIS